MSTTLVRFRKQALARQNGRCCYCGLPVVTFSNLLTFASAHKLSEARAKALQCTAEHLQARCDGGRDDAINIAVACITCNQRRHRMNPAPTPDRYAQIVKRQMENGVWHKRTVLDAVLPNNSRGSPLGGGTPGVWGATPCSEA